MEQQPKEASAEQTEATRTEQQEEVSVEQTEAAGTEQQEEAGAEQTEAADTEEQSNLSQTKPVNRSNSNNRSRVELKSRSSKMRHYSTPWSKVFWTYWTECEAVDGGFEVQGTFPQACHVLTGYDPRSKWERGEPD